MDGGAALWCVGGPVAVSALRRAAFAEVAAASEHDGSRTDEFSMLLALACWLHERSGQGTTSGAVDHDRGVIFLRSREPGFAAECLLCARDWLGGVTEDSLVGLAARLNTVRDDECLGPSTLSIVSAAERRGIPTLRLSPVDSLVQLGWGVLGRRIWAAETDASRAIPNEIAQDKDLARRLLRAAGIPVTEGVSVGSGDEAWRAAQHLGVPVVVKPQTGSKGRGVSIGLTTMETVRAAYEVAASFGQGVVVERFARGTHHRVLVVGGAAIAASRASEEVVFGDGVLTVAELVERANEDPRRSFGHASVLTRLELDAIALELLERRGLSPTSVPAFGEKIFIHLNGDLTTDVTDQMHPEVAQVCVDAAFAIGLSLTGVDLLVEDIGRPLAEQDGVVVELNARPGLLAHLEPVEGTPRDVGAAILDTLFPSDVDGRIPTVVVVGDGRAPVARLLRGALALEFPGSGAATSEGLFVGNRRLVRDASDDAEGVTRLLMHRSVDVLLSERSPDGLLREGLVLDRVDVVVLAAVDRTDAAAELFSSGGAKHVVVRAGLDLVCAPGARRAVFGPIDHPEVRAALASGLRVAYLERAGIVFRDGEGTARLQLTEALATSPHVEHLCAAGLALTALDCPLPRVVERLRGSLEWLG